MSALNFLSPDGQPLGFPMVKARYKEKLLFVSLVSHISLLIGCRAQPPAVLAQPLVGSDESTSSSPGQGETDGDGDESDLGGESEDEIVTHVETLAEDQRGEFPPDYCTAGKRWAFVMKIIIMIMISHSDISNDSSNVNDIRI